MTHILGSYCFVAEVTFKCNAALAMTGVIQGTNIEKLYQELGLESLQNRRKL